MLLPILLLLWTGLPAQTLQEQIDAIFARPALAGNVWTGYAVSEDGGLVHYSHQPDTPRIPASNAKITTTSAAYELLGPDYSFQSRVYANGTITGGVLNGDLNLVVEHDPTWSTRYFANARTPLNHIASRVRTVAGITAVTGNVRVYGASVYNHTSTGNLGGTSQLNHNNTSAAAFRDALIANSVAVGGSASGLTGFSPPGTLVYTHESSDIGGYNLNMLIRPLNKISINPSADMMLRHMGYKLNGNDPGSDTYSAGRVHVEAWMAAADKPFDSTGFAQADGSGLSRNNFQTSRMMVGLMQYMHENHPAYEPSYTIACTDGTLGGRLCGADTTGRVHGKTGSLSVTISLSGYVRNRHINERVYFSFLHNRSSSIDQAATRQAIDDAVRLLAAADVPTFQPPGRPELFNLRKAGTMSSFIMQWTSAADADVYHVYRSVNGGEFELHALVNAPSTFLLDPVENSALYAYRVVATNEDGEGVSSSAMLGRLNAPGPLIGIVRGSTESAPSSIDPIPAGMAALVSSIGDDYGIEMTIPSRVAMGGVNLSNFAAVQWYFEHNVPESHTFSAEERGKIEEYLTAGGAMLVSGSKLATNMDPTFNGNATTGAFLHDVLMHRADALSSGVGHMNSQGSVLFQGINASTLSDCDTSFPIDVVAPIGSARDELVFQPGPAGSAALSFDEDYRLVIFPVPFDCILQVERRDAYMDRILNFLIPPDTSDFNDTFTVY